MQDGEDADLYQSDVAHRRLSPVRFMTFYPATVLFHSRTLKKKKEKKEEIYSNFLIALKTLTFFHLNVPRTTVRERERHRARDGRPAELASTSRAFFFRF